MSEIIEMPYGNDKSLAGEFIREQAIEKWNRRADNGQNT